MTRGRGALPITTSMQVWGTGGGMSMAWTVTDVTSPTEQTSRIVESQWQAQACPHLSAVKPEACEAKVIPLMCWSEPAHCKTAAKKPLSALIVKHFSGLAKLLFVTGPVGQKTGHLTNSILSNQKAPWDRMTNLSITADIHPSVCKTTTYPRSHYISSVNAFSYIPTAYAAINITQDFWISWNPLQKGMLTFAYAQRDFIL